MPLLPALSINKCCANYIGFDSLTDRIFWSGDLFVVRYEGELGMGHEYVDAPLTLARLIKDIRRSAYQRRALEGIVEDDDKFERAMQRGRKWNKTNDWLLLMGIWMKGAERAWFHAAVETGAPDRFRTGQPLSNGDILLLRQTPGAVG